MASPPAPTEPSPFTAAEEAGAYTQRTLFPFRFGTWLTLGFASLLDQCGRSGAGFPGGPGGSHGGEGGGGGGGLPDAGEAWAWVLAHGALLVGIVLGAALVFLAFFALVLWIGSRGTFVYLDNVATGRAEIGRPWSQHARHANGYMAASALLIGAVVLSLMLVAVAGLAGAVLLAQKQETAGAVMIGVAVVGFFGFLLVAFASGLGAMLLRDFVAPLQMVTGLGCRASAGLLWSLMLAHPAAFLVYVLLRIVYAMVVGIATLVLGCCTCCFGFLPVVSQTLLQPLHYFERAWSLCLLRQLGYDAFAPPPGTTVSA